MVALLLSGFAVAGSAQEPVHEAVAVLEAVYETAGITPEDVNVVMFKYDYLSGRWHVELSPRSESCLDCFPSFHIQNNPELTVSTSMHG